MTAGISSRKYTPCLMIKSLDMFFGSSSKNGISDELWWTTKPPRFSNHWGNGCSLGPEYMSTGTREGALFLAESKATFNKSEVLYFALAVNPVNQRIFWHPEGSCLLVILLYLETGETACFVVVRRKSLAHGGKLLMPDKITMVSAIIADMCFNVTEFGHPEWRIV